MSNAQQLTVNVYNFAQLPEEAKQVVIQKHIESGCYDNSIHEQADYNYSLSVFASAFNSISGSLIVGEVAKDQIVQAINRAVQIQAKENPYFGESLQTKYNGVINNIKDAIEIAQNCPFTGVCTDFYLMDTIIKYLDGTAHQDLTVKALLSKAKANGRNELAKQCRYYKSRKHVEESLNEYCEDLFFADCTKVPQCLYVDQAV